MDIEIAFADSDLCRDQRGLAEHDILWSKFTKWNDAIHSIPKTSLLRKELSRLITEGTSPPRTVGVEIEVENFSERFLKLDGDGFSFCTELVDPETRALWKPVRDGSLRGFCAVELVSLPLPVDIMAKALTHLYQYIEGASFGFRTSTHVHVDVNDYKSADLYKLLLIYITVEKLLFNSFPQERQKNIYCVPLTQSQAVDHLKQTTSISWGKLIHLCSLWQKYCALNISSWHYMGTVEFRHMHASPSPIPVFDWVKVCEKLVSRSREIPFKDLTDKLMSLNTSSQYVSYLKWIFEDTYSVISTNNLSLNMETGVTKAKLCLVAGNKQELFCRKLKREHAFATYNASLSGEA